MSVKNIIKDKYFVLELLVLLFLCYFRPLISDVEYSAYEQKDIRKFSEVIETRLVWGSFAFVFLSAFYWGILKRIVLLNRHWLVVAALPLFVVLYHLYDFYIMDTSISKMSFLEDELRKKSILRIQRSKLYFTVNYKLSYDYLPLTGLAYLVRALQQYHQIRIMKEQQLLSELKYLKDKLHPHFFFNTLNNIYSLAIQQSPQTAPMVAGLSDLMRYMLYESDKTTVPLKREIEMLQQYVELEKLRYGNRYRINFETQSVKNEDRIPPLLLLPFIENAFKHGMQNAVEDGYVDIVILRVDDLLMMKVKNSVVQTLNKRESGIGLHTVEQRLKLLYNTNYDLNVKEHENEYEVILSIKIDA